MLIEIDGPSGSGKTTLIHRLTTADSQFINIAEHEQHPDELAWLIGSFMRELTTPAEPVEAAFLYCTRTAARARLIAAGPAGAIAIADRFRLSLTVAIHKTGLPETQVRALVALATRGHKPDHTILLDVDHATHAQRLTARGDLPINEQEFDDTRSCFAAAYAQVPEPKQCLSTVNLSPGQVVDAVAGQVRAVRSRSCSISS